MWFEARERVLIDGIPVSFSPEKIEKSENLGITGGLKVRAG